MKVFMLGKIVSPQIINQSIVQLTRIEQVILKGHTDFPVTPQRMLLTLIGCKSIQAGMYYLAGKSDIAIQFAIDAANLLEKQIEMQEHYITSFTITRIRYHG